MVSNELLSGYPIEGSELKMIKPLKVITRAEAAAVICKAINLKNQLAQEAEAAKNKHTGSMNSTNKNLQRNQAVLVRVLQINETVLVRVLQIIIIVITII